MATSSFSAAYKSSVPTRRTRSWIGCLNSRTAEVATPRATASSRGPSTHRPPSKKTTSAATSLVKPGGAVAARQCSLACAATRARPIIPSATNNTPGVSRSRPTWAAVALAQPRRFHEHHKPAYVGGGGAVQGNEHEGADAAEIGLAGLLAFLPVNPHQHAQQQCGAELPDPLEGQFRVHRRATGTPSRPARAGWPRSRSVPGPAPPVPGAPVLRRG